MSSSCKLTLPFPHLYLFLLLTLLMETGCFRASLPGGLPVANPHGPSELVVRPPVGADWPTDLAALDPENLTAGSMSIEALIHSEQPDVWPAIPQAFADEHVEGRLPPGSQPPTDPSNLVARAHESIDVASPNETRVAKDSALAQLDQDRPISARVAWAWKAFFRSEFEDAYRVFAQVADDAPYRADAFLGTGRCLLALGDLDGAEAQLELAWSTGSTLPDIPFYLGVVDYQRENFVGAIDRWEAMAALMKTRPPGPLQRDRAWLLARAYLEIGALDQGMEAFEEALRLGGEDGRGRLHPPDPFLERLADGALPGEAYQPIGGRTRVRLDVGLLIEEGGAIWRIGEGKVRRRVTHPPVGWRDGLPAVDQTGHRLAFVSWHRSGTAALMVQEGGVRRILCDGDVAAVRPAWSGGGELLAFVKERAETGELRVYTVSVDGGDTRGLSWQPGSTTDPVFLGNGHVLVSARVGGQYSLAEVALNGSEGVFLPPLRPVSAMDGTIVTGFDSQQALPSPRRRGVDRKRPLFVPEIWGGESLHPELWRDAPMAAEDAEASPGDRAVAIGPAGDPGGASVSSEPLDPKGDSPWSLLERGETRRSFGAPSDPDGGDVASLPAGMDMRDDGLDDGVEAGIQIRSPADLADIKRRLLNGEMPFRTRILTGEEAAALSRDGSDDREPNEIEIDGHPAPPEAYNGDVREATYLGLHEGRLIAYTREWAGNRQVWLREPDQRVELHISPVGVNCWSPTFSPDGRRVAYVCLEGGIVRPYVYERATRRRRVVYRQPLSVNSPHWLKVFSP